MSFFNFGADGAHATEAISLKAATNEPTGLTSQGKPILISVSSDGKTLTGTADGREVFTLKLNAQGTSYTFELKDQIDHPTLNNVASGSDGAFNDAENLLSSGTPSSLLDLSQFIVGKDGDGDTVTLTAGKFVIDVRDDIPTVTNAAVNVKIDTPEIVAPVEGKVANFVLVLDTSGSVTVAALKLQVTNFLSQLADSEAQDVRVHIVQFNNTASPVGTFDLIVDGDKNVEALSKALAAVNAFTGGGNTNYEAGLLEAQQWIEGANTLTVNSVLDR
ncbi:MAG: VWA domain-containing protein, partial [Allorhizobium sp.]